MRGWTFAVATALLVELALTAMTVWSVRGAMAAQGGAQGFAGIAIPALSGAVLLAVYTLLAVFVLRRTSS